MFLRLYYKAQQEFFNLNGFDVLVGTGSPLQFYRNIWKCPREFVADKQFWLSLLYPMSIFYKKTDGVI
jgi:hypothetical protein